jgi:hypothetical protein
LQRIGRRAGPAKNKSPKSGKFSAAEIASLKNHVFTTICPQKTIQKPRSAHRNLRNPSENIEKHDLTTPEKISYL